MDGSDRVGVGYFDEKQCGRPHEDEFALLSNGRCLDDLEHFCSFQLLLLDTETGTDSRSKLPSWSGESSIGVDRFLSCLDCHDVSFKSIS